MTCEKSRSNIQLKKRCAKTMYSITHFFMYPPHICVYACRLDIYTRKGKEWHEIGVPQMGNLCTFFWMFTKVIHMLYNKNLNLWTSSHTPPRPPHVPFAAALEEPKRYSPNSLKPGMQQIRSSRPEALCKSRKVDARPRLSSGPFVWP